MNPNATVSLRPGLRLQWEPAQKAYVLLYPEGMIKLNGPAGEILSRCDGRLVCTVITELSNAFPGADLADDVLEFLAEAQDKGWIITEG